MSKPKQQTVTYEEESRKGRRTSFVWYEGDDVLLDYIVEYLGCSKSEAVRSALRAFATQIATIQKTRQGG